MPKSKLSSGEMKRLRGRGRSHPEIAQMAEVTQIAVSYRLNPASRRQKARDRYRGLGGKDRETYLNQTRKRRMDAQDETALFVERRGDRWTKEEIDYLREYGTTKTTRDLALDLGRTFFGVNRAGERYKIPFRKP